MPRPLAQMPEDLRRSILGIAFDIDDTVTREGKLESTAFEAMWRLHAGGVHLVPVTGRPIGWLHVIARHWPVELAIGENGAGWVSFEGRVTKERFFHDASERAVQAARLAALRASVALAFPSVPTTGDDWARRCDAAWDIGETARVEPSIVTALVRHIESAGMRASVSTVHAHAIPGEWDKARGVVRAVRDVLGGDLEAERERWLFVGDSGNDAEAFSWFPASIGVANVRPWLDSLPVPPTWICAVDHGAGFAEVADAVLASRERATVRP